MLRITDCRFAGGTLLDVQAAPDMRSLLLLTEAEYADGPQGDLLRMRRGPVQILLEGIRELRVQRRPELPADSDEPADLPACALQSIQLAETLDEWERPCYEFRLFSELWQITAVAAQVAVLRAEQETDGSLHA